MTSPTQNKGNRFEDLAEQLLQSQGLSSVAKNLRTNRGELDLIMQDKETLVFVEVRYRERSEHGRAAETVNFSKQNKLRKAAAFFLQNMHSDPLAICRFDVVGISENHPRFQVNSFQVVNTSFHELSGFQIEWIKNAFDGFA